MCSGSAGRWVETASATSAAWLCPGLLGAGGHPSPGRASPSSATLAKPFPGAGVGLQLLLLSLPSLQGAVLNGTSGGPTSVHFALQVAPPWGAVSPHRCPF